MFASLPYPIRIAPLQQKVSVAVEGGAV